jgi:two-component system cell cycle sensor histidine kinase/response regulator CckA
MAAPRKRAQTPTGGSKADGRGMGEQATTAAVERERSDAALRASEGRYRRALEATQAALQRTEALYRVGSSVVAGETVETILQRVVDAMAAALPAYRVNLFGMDFERGCVTANVRGGPGADPLIEIGFEELLEGLVGWVLRERTATVSPGGEPDPRESDAVQKRRRESGLGSLLVAPIVYSDRALGAIVASNRPEDGEFDQADVDLLSAMAAQAAIAIENASIREQLQSTLDELEDRVAQRTAELAASEERYRRITETMTDYVFHVTVRDGEAVATSHGAGCVAVTGYSPDDFAADPSLWLRMVLEDDREAVMSQAREVESGIRARAIEHRIVRQDGAVRWVRSTPAPQYDPEGNLIGYDGLIQDITERRALEDQLVQAQKLQSIGRLAGGVAHDFNNLLTAILGNAELALLDLDEGHPARASIDEVVKAAEGAARLTRQLLSFARKQMIEPVPLDLSEVVADSLEMLRRLLGEDVEVTAALEPRLGLVEADPGQIQQVLVNLTVNARDAMPMGGHLAIETANQEVRDEYATTRPDISPGRYVSLTVTDTGTGMSEEVRSHLFEPFFTTKAQGEGTGLGLATCHGIVKQCGGHIWVHSELGQGTQVVMMLPQCETGVSPESQARVAHGPARGTETVLVVEDEPSVRRLAVLGLRSHGYKVLEAATAAEALAVAAEAPDLALVVSDVIMPGMRGPELAAQVTGIRPAAKLLLTSGHTDAPEGFRDADGRPVPFLAKPFTPERLAHKVRSVLDELA